MSELDKQSKVIPVLADFPGLSGLFDNIIELWYYNIQLLCSFNSAGYVAGILPSFIF
jgi:hypothetical protein